MDINIFALTLMALSSIAVVSMDIPLRYSFFLVSCFFGVQALTISGAILSVPDLHLLLTLPSLLIRSFFANNKCNLNIGFAVFVFFALYVMLSPLLAVPNRGVMVIPYSASYLELYLEPLYFTLGDFIPTLKPFLYLVLCFYFISVRFTAGELRTIALLFISSGIIVGLSGLTFQIFSLFSPDDAKSFFSRLYFFDAASTEISDRTDYQSFGSLVRAYSLAGEPGFTAMCLTSVSIALLSLFYILNEAKDRFPNVRKIKNFHIIKYTFFVLLPLTLSTTGFVGLVAAYSYSQSQLRLTRKITFAIGVIIFLGAMYLILPTAFLSYVTSEHLGKIITGAGSGDVRTLVSVYSLQVFSEAPLFGVGLGAHRSSMFGLMFLTSFGLVGVLVLMSLILSVRHSTKVNQNFWGQTFLRGYVYSLVIAAFSQTGVAFVQPWLWVLLALSFAGVVPHHYKRRWEIKNEKSVSA